MGLQEVYFLSTPAMIAVHIFAQMWALSPFLTCTNQLSYPKKKGQSKRWLKDFSEIK